MKGGKSEKGEGALFLVVSCPFDVPYNPAAVVEDGPSNGRLFLPFIEPQLCELCL